MEKGSAIINPSVILRCVQIALRDWRRRKWESMNFSSQTSDIGDR